MVSSRIDSTVGSALFQTTNASMNINRGKIVHNQEQIPSDDKKTKMQLNS